MLIVLSWRIFQRPSYEIFLRTHQGLAVLCAYSVWRHLPADRAFPRTYLYIFAGLFGMTLALEGGTIVARNGFSHYHRSHGTISSSCGMVKIRLQLSKSLSVKPGQYIKLWLPSASFWSFLQCHPFVVTSWSVAPQSTIDLFVQPRRGFTREILYLAQPVKEAKPHWVMFSGPYGRSIPVGKYEKVMMVADGAGIAAQLPYLKRLIHGYHARQVFTRRIHLIWQISNTGG